MTTSETEAISGMSKDQVRLEDESMAERARQARIVGRAWLADNRARPLRRVPRSRRFGLRVGGPLLGTCRRDDASGRCLKPDATGRAAAFPWRGIAIVAVGYECDHDGCTLTCNLHDRARRRWALTTYPADWESAPLDSAGSGSPCDLTTSATSALYIAGSKVCGATGCAQPSTDRWASVLGWLDPGIHVVGP